MTRVSIASWLLVVGLGLGVGPGNAAAQPRAPGAAPGAPPGAAPGAARPATAPPPGGPARPTLRQAQTALASTDPASVRAGITQCGSVGGAGAVQALAARIRDGLTPDLLDLAIGQLVALQRPEAGGILSELVQYRRPEVRRKAIEAIVATHAQSAETALAGALGDTDPAVRGAAAHALARIGARGSMPTLFAAFERGLPEAAGAMGVLARPAHVARIVGYLDTHPFANVAPALAELLRRRDVPAQTRVAAIAQIATHNVADVRGFLQQLISALPAADPVRAAAEGAMRSIEDAAGAQEVPATTTPAATAPPHAAPAPAPAPPTGARGAP